MCYSAIVWQHYGDYVRAFGADINITEFFRLYVDRKDNSKIKIPKAMDEAFQTPRNAEEREIAALIKQYNTEQASELEQELFKQRKRLADAERILKTKTTKKAENDQRIATDKVSKLLRRLEDLRRTAHKDRDARIFPGMYAPVMIWENGRRVVKPMRYQCRPAGKPAFYDRKYPGTYNARRDNLEGFWKGQFGHTHGVMVVETFFENVARHDLEHRELGPDEKAENVVLQFTPNPPQEMLVACLWSHWSGEGEPDLLSFAAITDEPPPEIAAAGHDRVIIQIKPENLDAWLNPDASNLAALHAILEDRQRPFYEHRMAA